MGDIVITPASNDVNSTAGTLVVRASDLNPISLRTNDVNRLYIDPTGSVGINTTSPTSKLNVVETTATGTRIQLGTSQEGTIMSANATNDLLILNAPYGANAATTSNLGAKWGIKFVGAVDSALNNNNKTSAIYAVSEDPLGYNRGTSLAFYTNQFNDIPYSEKMRIYHNGNIGIGITNPTNKVHISGGGISFTTSTGLAVPMLGIVLPTNIAYIGPYTTSTDGNAPTVVAFNQGSSVQQTWFYASGRISMVLNRQGRLHIGDNNNAPNCLLSVGPTSSTTAASGMCFGNDAQANLYRSSEDIIKTDGGLIVTNNLLVGELATNPSTKIRVNGSFSQRASGNTAIQEYKNIVAFNLDGNGNGGYVIKTPFRLGSSYEMVIIHVKGYGYGASTLYDFKIVFYDYAPSHQPVNYSLVDLGNDGSPKFLAKDADNYVQVCFGNTTDVNNYFYRFTVDCITTRNDNDYSQGWGMYQTTSANFGFASTGVYVVNSPVNFRTSNYVGIGTTNPVQKLQIEGVVGNPAFVGNIQSGIFRISNTSDNAALDFGLRPGGLGAWIQSTDESSLATNYPLLLNPNGANVGIGTTNPSTKLHVYGAGGGFEFGVGSSNCYIETIDRANTSAFINTSYYTRGTGYFAWYNGSYTERMRIDDAGNVGIGTTRQSGKLHVAGNIFLSADLIGNDGTRGYSLGKDSVSAGRVYLILDPNAANGIGVGSDYLYIAQENTTGVISNSAGPLLLNPGGGSVGIGITNPTYTLQVAGTFYVNSTSFFNGAMTVEDSLTVDGRLNGSDGVALLKMRAGNSAGSWNDVNLQYEKTGSIDSLHFNMGGSTISDDSVRLTVQNNGNIGIGTTRPAGLLHVFSTTGRYINFTPTSASGLLVQRNQLVTSQGTTVLTLANAQGPEVAANRGTALNLDIGYGGTPTVGGSIARGARIAALNHNIYDATAANQNAYLAFYTATGGTLTEKLRVNGDGSVGIGTTNTNYKLDVAGAIAMHDEAQDIDSRFYGATFLRGWQSFSNGSEANITYTTDGTSPVGVEVLSVSSFVWARGPRIRLDKTQNYEVEIWVKRHVANTAGTFYFVVSNYDSSGNVIAGDGTDWHYPASVTPPSTSWTKYTYIVGPYGGAKDHSSSARYISVGFIANYTTGTDVIYMTGFKCRPIPRYNNDNLTLLNNGNVGIGTTGVAGQLHIGGTASNNNPWMVLDINDSYFKRILFSEERNAYGITGYGGYIGYDASNNVVSIGSFEASGNLQSLNVRRENGRVGIGTIDPLERLNVLVGDGGANGTVGIRVGGTNNYRSLELGIFGAYDGMISSYGNNLRYYAGHWRTIGTAATEDHSHYWFTSKNGSANWSTVKMILDHDGKLGIGTDTPYSLLDVQLASASPRYATLSTNDGQGSFGGFGLNFRIANQAHDIAQIRGDYESSAAGGYGGLFFATRFSGTLYNRVAFNDNGRVGIGVSYATTLLSVGGAGSTTAASGITLGGDSVANLYRISTSRIKTDGSLTIDGGGGNAQALVLNRSSTSSENGISFSTAGTVDWYYFVDNATTNLQIQRSTEIDSAPRVRFNGANSDILFNLGGGNIGVGTSLPSGKLHVVSTISNDTVLRADGTNGTLFSVVDNLSDSLMSVNNSAGLPVLEVFADDKVVMGQYASGDFVLVNNKIGIGTTNPNNKLSVIGGASIGSTTYNTAAPTNGLIVQGNVGIGSTSPVYKLDCYSTNAVAEVARFFNNQTACNFSVGSSSNSQYSNYILYTNDGNVQFFRGGNAYSSWGGASSLNIYNSNGPIAFHPNNTANSMFLSTGGNLGIGETSPDYKLTVHNRSSVSSNSDIEIVCGGAGQASLRMFEDNSGTHTVYGARVYYEGAGNNFFNIATIDGGTETIGFTLNRSSNVGIGTITPAEKLDVRGGLIRSNARVTNDQGFPVGHYTPGETVFEIDPTWSQLELQKYFNSTLVSWAAVADAPGGYCIYIDGAVNAGGFAGSGFPYIPVDTNDIFYMECWIQNVGTAQGHYMGSQDFDQSFSSLGGNPGSYGYWVMSNYNPTTTWTKVSGYISGFSSLSADVGKFKTGTKYWTPQALFNYTAGTGTRACRISGWKVIKVYQVGDRSFAGNVNVAADLYVADELGVGVPIANKRLNYGAQISVASASIQLVLGRTATSTGQGAIGADDSNTFAVYNVSGGATRQFSVTQQGNVGVGNTTPPSRLTVLGPVLTANSKNTYAAAIGNDNNTDLTFGADASYAYIQSWGTKPLYINNQGNNVIVNANVGIGLTNPSYRLVVSGGDVNIASTNILRFGTVAVLNEASNANDIYANIRVIRNYSSVNQDGMYINYDSQGTTNAHLRFYANAGNERMRIDASNGNVGIGVTNPTTRLQVANTGTITSIATIRIVGSTGNNAGSQVEFYKAQTAKAAVGLASAVVGGGTSDDLLLLSTNPASIVFNAGANGLVAFKSDGNVGIGLTNPAAARLHIKGNTTDPVLRVETALLEAGTTTSSKTFVAWLPIMTGAAVGDKVFIPLFK